tara:strand:- start:117 stop:245 length:129 start_codon:yes stop_codon:yes gene_type:complete
MKVVKWHGINLNVPDDRKEWMIIGLIELIILVIILLILVIAN